MIQSSRVSVWVDNWRISLGGGEDYLDLLRWLQFIYISVSSLRLQNKEENLHLLRLPRALFVQCSRLGSKNSDGGGEWGRWVGVDGDTGVGISSGCRVFEVY